MSVIHLVRHGQASFGRSDYDRLSELGERQARLVGAAMAERGVSPTILVTGTMRRQRVTGSRLWEAAGWEAPVDVDEGWNEYDHDAIIAAFKPAYRNAAVMRADLARRGNPRRAFQQMFAEAAERWTSGEHDEDYPETFAQFRDRVVLAFGRVASRLESGQTGVVVTSGGPMSWVAARLLTASPEERTTQTAASPIVPSGALTVWHNLTNTTVNTGVTTVLAGRSLTALTMNDHTHLHGEPGLVSYR